MDANRPLLQLNASGTFQWVVSAEDDALRLDVFLARRLVSFSRRERTELIAERHVLVNGRPVVKSTRLRQQDSIVVALPFTPPAPSLSQIEVIASDDSILLLNKPAGIPSVALRHIQTQTAAHFLLKHFPETASAAPRRLEAGLVHRLDTETSGLLLAARTSSAYLALRRQFHEHKVGKQYLALVGGEIKSSGHITLPLESAGPRGRKMQIASLNQGQAALTHYVPVKQYALHTLVRVSIVTGVRHQIRAHLAAFGHPLVGDTMYGAEDQRDTRLCLHAETLVFQHPETGETLNYTSSLPEDFCTVLGQLDG